MTTVHPVIRPATPSDAQAIARLLGAAFQDDPPLQWIIPDDAERSRLGPVFFRPFVDLVLAAGSAFITADISAASLWLTVDITAPADDPTELHQALIDGIGAEYAKRFFVLDELFATHHPGHQSHDYLLFVGTLPHRQNQGLGTALLRHRFAQLDPVGQPSYLEASSVRSAALYTRLGFAPIGDGVALPDGPTLHPMWRSGTRPTGHPATPAVANPINTTVHLPGDLA